MTFIPVGIQDYIASQIRSNAVDVLGKLAIINLDLEQLYRELIDDERVYRVFTEAQQFLKFEHFRDNVFIRDNFMVNLFIPSTETMHYYLIPERGFRLTRESNLWPLVEANNKVATDWQMTITLFDQFKSLDARVVGSFFPWIKDILLDCDWFKGGPEEEKYRFKYYYNLGKVNDKLIDQALAQLIEGRPTRFPTLTPRINQACRLGNQLFAQARILSNTPDPELNKWMAHMESAMGGHLVPPWVTVELSDIMRAWEEEEQAREDARTRRKS